MGKMFTAVAIAQLVEQGRLTFDTRLIDVLPDYPNGEAAAAITIRQLLSHSAGIRGPLDSEARAFTDDLERVSDDLARFAHLPLAFAPGTRSSYSNEGFIILGAVIERLAGRSWYDHVRDKVLVPAGMRDTAFDFSDALRPGTAVGYRYAESDPLGVRAREPNTPAERRRGGPAGGAYSTAADMMAFLNAFRAGRLTSPTMVEQLLVPAPNGMANYGLGFFVHPLPDGRRAVGHGGGGPNSGIDGAVYIIWETGWSAAVLGNYDAPAAQSVSASILGMARRMPLVAPMHP